MSNSVQSLQSIAAQHQTQQTVQPPKKPQQTAQTSTPQDTVTISAAAKQAIAGTAKVAVSSDADHDGDSK